MMHNNANKFGSEILSNAGQLGAERICLLYKDRDEQFSAISKFVFGSITSNRRCVFISSHYGVDDIIEILRQDGNDFSDAVESSQLEVVKFQNSFIGEDKKFRGELLEVFLQQQLKKTHSLGFSNLNLIADMDWAAKDNPDQQCLLDYIAEINEFSKSNQFPVLYSYCKNSFTDEFICHLIASHGLIINSGKIIRNPDSLLLDNYQSVTDKSYDSMLSLMERWQNQASQTVPVKSTNEFPDNLAIEKDWILNIAKESFILYGPDAKIIWANNSAGAASALEPDEMQGLSCSAAHGCKGDSCQACPVSKVQVSGKPSEGELLTNDSRCLYLRVYPVYNENAEMTHIIEYGRDITERKKAETTLRGTLTELNAIHGNVPIAMLLLDSNLKIRKLNEAAVRLTGRDCMEIMDCAPGDALCCLNSLDAPGGCGCGNDCSFCTLRSSVTHTLKTGQAHQNVEGWLPFMEDGAKQYRCMLISTSRLNLLDEEMVLVSIQDITDIKRTEQELHLSEIRNRKIIDSSPMFIMLMRDGRYVYANPAAARAFGYAGPDKMLDRPVGVNIAFDQMGIIDKIADSSDAAASSNAVQLQLSRIDGVSFTSEVGAVSVQLQDGPATLIMGSDISEHIQTRQALAESQQRFREILETIDLYAVILNKTGDITYVNPHYCKLTGWDVEEVVGNSWFDHLPEENTAEVRKLFEDAISSGTLPAHREDMIVTRSGKHRFVVWNNVILRNAKGEATGTASIGMDITEHRHLEQQYQQSQKMEAIGRLAAGVAHDFNNQLTVIQGYCEMLLSGINEDDPRFRPLSEINRASLRAYSTTSHLLSFSRKQLLNPEVLELDKLLQDMRNPVSKMIGEDIRLSVITTEGLSPVKIDRSGMHQALMNLMVNARDAMPNGGDLTIKATNIDLEGEDAARRFRCSAPGKYVLLEISDTGTGIDESTMDKLFEPFFTTKEVGKGTGLGLPMVQGFVKQSNGSISVSSTPGEGATFSILLPPAKEAAEKKKDGVKGKKLLGKGSETILAVEDEESVRMLLTDLLGICGYDIHVAACFEDAVEIAESLGGKYDMLLSDMVMPEMNGVELAQKLSERFGEVPTLFMTGYASSDVRGKAKNILTKPFTPDSLTSAIRNTLEGKALVK